MIKLFNDVAYQIMRLSDTRYSTGGHMPQFNKKGKIWRSKSALNLHLVRYVNGTFPYMNCTIIENIITDGKIDIRQYNIYDWMDQLRKNIDKKDNDRTDSIRKKVIGFKIYDIVIDPDDVIIRIRIVDNKGHCKELITTTRARDITNIESDSL
jgi:hypothetical protein